MPSPTPCSAADRVSTWRDGNEFVRYSMPNGRIISSRRSKESRCDNGLLHDARDDGQNDRADARKARPAAIARLARAICGEHPNRLP